MKYENYRGYDPVRVALAESAFLTVWAGLGSWHQELVLVGGLVPKYLCGDPTVHRDLPRPATLDVDLGIALATESGQYGSILWDLRAQGFERNPNHSSRFEKRIGDFIVPVDFLVEKPPWTSGTAAVDEIIADIMPGVDRALATARRCVITGTDLHGAEQRLNARVCEAGPFLALKLRAFYHRQQPKDAFDILYTALHYDGGTDAAVAAFGEEARRGNPGVCGRVAGATRDVHAGNPARSGEGELFPARRDDARRGGGNPLPSRDDPAGRRGCCRRSLLQAAQA